jgi:hypothetical protein
LVIISGITFSYCCPLPSHAFASRGASLLVECGDCLLVTGFGVFAYATYVYLVSDAVTMGSAVSVRVSAWFWVQAFGSVFEKEVFEILNLSHGHFELVGKVKVGDYQLGKNLAMCGGCGSKVLEDFSCSILFVVSIGQETVAAGGCEPLLAQFGLGYEKECFELVPGFVSRWF